MAPAVEIRAQDERLRMELPHPFLAQQLAARVFIQRRRRVVLAIVAAVASEQVVGGDVHQIHAAGGRY